MLKRNSLWVFCLLVLSACSGSGDSNSDDDTADEMSQDQQPVTTEMLQRVSNDSCIAPDNPTTGNSEYSLEPAFPDLPQLDGLLGLFQSPGDASQWYALLREGRILVFDNSVTANSLTTVLDINTQVMTDGEMGMLGMAFHPNFSNNGEFFVHYNNAASAGASTISRFTVQGSLPVSPATEDVLLSVAQPSAFHNGGSINFGLDGYLYIALGDGDSESTAQDSQSLLGAMLRIDVDSGTPYAIPGDNPFVGDSNFRPEIFAMGLRNPWRWSIDPQSGDIWLADVGDNTVEEVDLIGLGNNYGWPVMEGTQCVTPGCNTSPFTLPVAEHIRPDSGFCSITGGHVWRSNRLPALLGSFIYGDLCSGTMWRVVPNGGSWLSEPLIDNAGGVVSFAQGNDGEVYRLNMFAGAGESAYRIVEIDNGGSQSTIPTNLSDTGCFASTAAKTKAAAVVPYDVTSALWSDGANKLRAFAIPDGTQLDVQADGDFIFPVGAVLIKDFLDGDRYIETRLLMRHINGWAGYSYEWQADGNDAQLLDAGKTEDTGNFIHTFPSSSECNACHSNAANFSLGLEASQQNTAILYPGLTQPLEQLTALHGAGFIAETVNPSAISTLASLDDSDASLAVRARSYLHSNCSGCHRPNGPAAFLDLRIQTPLASTGTCDELPTRGDLGLANARIISPGNPASSVLLARMATAGPNRMPPLASLIEDQQATALISTWINEMQNCL